MKYAWAFPALDAYPQVGDEKDVVFTVHYIYAADDGEGHTASVYGTVGITHTAKSPFTPFSDLTFNQVQGWVVAALGNEQLKAMKANVDGQIADQINPKVVSLAPPWVVAESAPVV